MTYRWKSSNTNIIHYTWKRQKYSCRWHASQKTFICNISVGRNLQNNDRSWLNFHMPSLSEKLRWQNKRQQSITFLLAWSLTSNKTVVCLPGHICIATFHANCHLWFCVIGRFANAFITIFTKSRKRKLQEKLPRLKSLHTICVQTLCDYTLMIKSQYFFHALLDFLYILYSNTKSLAVHQLMSCCTFIRG
jgi:hypothetical protein